MKKKSIACLMVATLVCGSVAMPMNNIQKETMTASSAVYDEVPEGYTGVYTIDDLYAIRNNLSGKYILMNDIDLSATAPGGDWDSGNGWSPIDGFSGTFDGNGYAIKNMHIYGDVSSGSYGLFGNSAGSNGRILRLALINCNIDLNISTNLSSICIGSIVGGIKDYYNYTSVKNCYATGSVNVSIDCTSKSNYTRYYIGGIAGNAKIDNSFNNCDINVSVIDDNSKEHADYKNYFCIGGVTGYNGTLTGDHSIDSNYLYNSGKISVEKEDSSLGSYEVGNIISDDFKSGLLNSYYLKTLSDYTATAGKYCTDSGYSNVAGLTVGQMKSQSAFVGFDFDNVWTIDPDAEYPYPTLREVPYVSSGSSGNSGNSGSSGDSGNSGNSGSLMGDMNGDGLVDAVDASYILQYYAYASTGGTIKPDEYFSNLHLSN